MKAAIHTLLVRAKSPDAPACLVYNAALVVCLLLVRLSNVGPGLNADGGNLWRWHFQNRSDYAAIVMMAGERLLELKPVGEAMFRVGLLLLDIATSLEGAEQKMVLNLTLELLREHDRRSPNHLYVKYVLAKAMAQSGEPPEEVLKMYELCSVANPCLGLMEAAALLMDQDRVQEAFAKMEQQVGVDPMLAYGQWARLLSVRLERLMKTKGKELKGKELRRALEDVKRNYEVNSQLSQVIPANNRAVQLDMDAFMAFEQSLQLPPPNQNRVEFVPRVEENPFVEADFENEFL